MTLPVIHRFVDADQLADASAELIRARLDAAIAAAGRASLALAGGKTPQALHSRLAKLPLDWSRIHIYFGDDRCVPPYNEASNYRAARKSLLDHVPIPGPHIHRIEGERGPGEAAALYNAVIAEAQPIDVIVLGMGDDGHTASLFPGEPEPPAGALVAATHSPVSPQDRVTLTLPAIRACGTVILQVTGANKAARLAQVYAELTAGTPTFPVAKIGPAIWMIDEAAAALIPRSE